uniref:Uncharacterized protein n=1 Tax=Desertifilum tharense IPPAS B-1220 TaxID=1781255 RepID=A0ACD5GMG2_9CYAN
MAVSDPIIDSFSQTLSGITVALGEDAKGQGGSINLVAERLRVFNGGQIISSTDGEGDAGSVNLRVNRLEVQGSSQLLVEGNNKLFLLVSRLLQLLILMRVRFGLLLIQ